MNRITFFICATLIALVACNEQSSDKQTTKETTLDSLSSSNNDSSTASNKQLIKIYSQAIADYITEVAKQNITTFDTLYFGKRNSGQPDDFPDIELPEKIKNVNIKLIAPEFGQKLQAERKSRVYINLMGWVEKDSAEFIFVTFSNGFEHKFDYYINYKYNSDTKGFDAAKSRIEKFSK